MKKSMNSSRFEISRRRFLRTVTTTVAVLACVALWRPAVLHAAALEKTEFKFGFIKLTDCAPLVIAKEKVFSMTRVSTSPWKRRRTGKFCSIA